MSAVFVMLSVRPARKDAKPCLNGDTSKSVAMLFSSTLHILYSTLCSVVFLQKAGT